MSNLLDRTNARRSRIALQAGAALVLAAAVGLSFVDNVVVRAAVIAALAVVVLGVLKLAMVAAHGAHAAQRAVAAASGTDAAPVRELRAVQAELRTLQTAHEDLRSRQEELLAVCERLESELTSQAVEVGTLASLSRRVEPTVAETAVLQHEVTYLRETVARLERTNGSA